MAKLPKNIQDIVDRKQDYIDSNRDKLEASVIKMQEAFLQRFIEEILPSMDTKDGQILNTPNNLRLIEKLDSLYDDFNKTNQTKVVKSLGESLLGLNKINTEYFNQITLNDVTAKRFDSVKANTDKLMGLRIGIDENGEVQKSSYLDSFITDNTLLTELKQSVIRNITGQQTIESSRKDIRERIVGNKEVTGGFEKYYRTFAYDTYQEYDRSYGKQMADEFKMDYAIYQGGLIKDSRDFCKAHENKVYTRDEIKDFKNWKLPDDSVESPGPGKVPSYIAKFPNYDPNVHCGGFNCRHQLSWVTKSVAERMRPDLKVVKVIEPDKNKEPEINLTLDQAKEKMKSLQISDIHKKTISEYTGEKFNQINQYLGGQRKQVTDPVKETINELSSFLDSAPKVTATSYRGKKGDRIFEEFKSLKKGDTYSEKAFMSTTYDKNIADNFANGSYNKVLMTIKGKSGVLVESYSDARTEKEILFNKGSKYKIESIKSEKQGKYGKILVFLIEI